MKIFYEVGTNKKCKKAYEKLVVDYPACNIDEAEVIVVIGGDGFMLQNLHKYLGSDKKVYGLNFGSVGFMMNPLDGNLINAIKSATQHTLNPLEMTSELTDSSIKTLLAFNEVSMHRMIHQAVHLKISVSGKVRMKELVCDGALVATPAGSTAYNLSAHGPVLPLDCNAMTLTPISAFRPRRWRGAILNNNAEILFECLDYEKRPVSATADNKELQNVKKITVRTAKQHNIIILANANHDLEERIISEQFY